MSNSNSSQVLTKGQKISEARNSKSPEEKAAIEAKRLASRALKQDEITSKRILTLQKNLTDTVKAEHALDRNQDLRKMIDDISAIFRLYTVVNNAVLTGQEYQSFLDKYNETYTDNRIFIHPHFPDQITIEYSSENLNKNYGRRAYNLWKNLFIRLTQGGKNKTTGDKIVSRWMINQERLREIEERITNIHSKNKKLGISDRTQTFVEVLIGMESKSLEYTEVKVEATSMVEMKVVGVPKTKKIIPAHKKEEINKTRKELRATYIEPTKSMSFVEKIENINDLVDKGSISRNSRIPAGYQYKK